MTTVTPPQPAPPPARAPGVSAGGARVTAMLAVLLVTVVALPYLQVRQFDFVNYDDPLHVSEQPMVLRGLSWQGIEWSLTATDSNLWHPLTWVSYMADVSLFGGGADQPGVHHLVNLILHLLAVAALFGLLRLLGVAPLLAWLAAALYGLHPLQAEPVAWISARKDMLSTLPALLCLLVYSRCRLVTLNGTTPHPIWRGLVWLLLAAALAAKPSAVVLPGLFVVVDGLLARSQHPGTAAWWRFLIARSLAQWPYLLLAGAAALTAIAVQQAGSHALAMAGQSLADRLTHLPARLGFFVQRTLWPVDLAFDYPQPSGRRWWLWSAIGLGLLAAIGWLLASRSPARRLWGLGLGWYVVCLVPVLGLVYVSPSFTNDRYLHLGLAGPLIALALWPSTRGGAPARFGRAPAVIAAGMVLLVPLMGVMTWRQTAVWRDTGSLFRHGVEAAPMSATAWSNLASWHAVEGRHEQALEHYRRALALEPHHPVAHHNVGYLQWTAGRTAEAIDSLQRSVAANPVYAPAHNLLGVLLGNPRDLARYRPREAIDHLRRAHEIQPANDLYLKDYAEALLAYGEIDSALEVLNRGLPRLDPDSPRHGQIVDLKRSLEATGAGR